jgi:outer membrane protein assembly factor BamB
MSQTIPSRRVRWKPRITAVAALALLLAAFAAPARATTPVPGIDYDTGPAALQPPPIAVLQSSSGLAPGDVFAAPKKVAAVSGQLGPEIVDNQGRPIWFQPVDDPYTATDFRVQRYQGKPVLTFDVGQSTGGPGHSEGEDVILDRHYHQIATVSAGNGLKADQHEFRLTADGTALITAYENVPYDLSSVGGPANGHVLDGVVQEVDVATGKVLFQWDSLDHVPLSDSYQPLPANPSTPYDYFHVNGVSVDSDGNLLISGRHTWTVYKVDRTSGEVIWRLGGKESDFQLGPGAGFSWQHNAEAEAGQPNTIRIFDNGSNGVPVEPQSRIIDLRLDPAAKTATLVDSVQHPDGVSAPSQGNAQRLPDGHLFVGWGQTGRLSEFDAAGKLLWDAQVPPGYDSYRGYRSPWLGQPTTDPTAEARRVDAHHLEVDAIWNGATEVERWAVLAGPHPWSLHRATVASWNGLDTTIALRAQADYVEVVALDADGETIGRSPAVEVSD